MEKAIDPVFHFPRGTRAGHSLHDLFEHLDFRDAACPAMTMTRRSAGCVISVLRGMRPAAGPGRGGP
ncbi:hypothetical protein THSYN_10685 [Candidatus Thiodictyon syntrophicum]|uniref:Uncharacterized protein n=1 Tax=Candidatus Thiodictyon syntrophicum TaxID=1166950 RepID=A0A2K8U8J4_9GAMM|nr:hypothetical protein THSYN_10685 [Candidatus Thiodictyon syntrophicum]